MTTLREHWEAESDNPDICLWLEESLRPRVQQGWTVSVRRPFNAQAHVITVFVTQCEFELALTAHIDVREPLGLDEAVARVVVQLNDSFEEYQEKLSHPFVEATP